ncbi:MAG: hypothetical protein NW226_16280 [Microscillaceae bacterium]|nr:hypothetical protein [Microscillaceae bacterium]
MRRLYLNPFQMVFPLNTRRSQAADRILNTNLHQASGKDFMITIRRKDEYALGGSFDFAVDKFFEIMTPNSMSWRGLSMESRQWNIEVGSDKIKYHWDLSGIHIQFNDEISFRKAFQIAEEVSKNLEKHTGYPAKMEISPKPPQSLRDGF